MIMSACLWRESIYDILKVCQFGTQNRSMFMSATPSLPRITARVDAETQALLTRAAGLAGMSSINSFVVNAAIEKAREVIEREQTLRLTERDAILLAEALDKSGEPHPRLRQAHAHYRKLSGK